MFNRLFGRKSDPSGGGEPADGDPKAGPQLAMPLLENLAGLSRTKVAAAWDELFPKEPPLKKGGEPQGPWEFTTASGRIMAIPIARGIPGEEIPAAAERSWMWPEAAQAVARQRAHLVVASPNASDAVAAASDVTRVCAAVLKAAGPAAVGVYWGNSSQVHEPKMFMSSVTQFLNEGELPTMLWVGVVVSAPGRQGPFTVSTHGLRALGHKEFEVIDSRLGLGELRMQMFQLASYVLRSGPVLLHGQTIGPDAATKWKIEHTISRFRDGESVIRLHM